MPPHRMIGKQCVESLKKRKKKKEKCPWRECGKGPSVSRQTPFQIHTWPGICRLPLFKCGNVCEDSPLSLQLVWKAATAPLTALFSTVHPSKSGSTDRRPKNTAYTYHASRSIQYGAPQTPSGHISRCSYPLRRQQTLLQILAA